VVGSVADKQRLWALQRRLDAAQRKHRTGGWQRFTGCCSSRPRPPCCLPSAQSAPSSQASFAASHPFAAPSQLFYCAAELELEAHQEETAAGPPATPLRSTRRTTRQAAEQPGRAGSTSFDPTVRNGGRCARAQHGTSVAPAIAQSCPAPAPSPCLLPLVAAYPSCSGSLPMPRCATCSWAPHTWRATTMRSRCGWAHLFALPWFMPTARLALLQSFQDARLPAAPAVLHPLPLQCGPDCLLSLLPLSYPHLHRRTGWTTSLKPCRACRWKRRRCGRQNRTVPMHGCGRAGRAIG